jgi:hypothetical protein
MSGLYPIVRRVRRPLLPVDWPADAKPAPAPVAPAANEKPEQADSAKHRNVEGNHGETTSSEPAS